MSKNSKAYKAAAEKVDRTKLYSPLEALALAKETSSTKMDATVEVAMRLGVDSRKADQMVRGTVNLPNGTGKTARVIVFAAGEKATEAEAAGADAVGAEDLIEKIQGGWLEFDAAIATPDQMAKVGRVARARRGLTAQPRGHLTMDVTKACRTSRAAGDLPHRQGEQPALHRGQGRSPPSSSRELPGRDRRDHREAVHSYGPLPAEDHHLHHDQASVAPRCRCPGSGWAPKASSSWLPLGRPLNTAD